MMNSRSRASTSSLAGIAALVVAIVAFGLAAAPADAAPRKRVVVLDFDGPKADKFHDDVLRLVKKSYTLVPTDKWNGTAEELGATKPTDANVKKVAKKLKIDGVITGRIEKRRDEYLVHLKLRNGKTGGVANSADTKSSGPRLDGKASTDVKDELLDAIDQLGAGGGKGGDDDVESSDDDADAKPAAATTKKKPAAKKPAASDDDDDADAKPAAATPKKKPAAAKKPAAPAASDDDDDLPADAPKHSGFSKKKPAAGKKPAAPAAPAASDDEDDADAKPAASAKKPATPAAKKKPAVDPDAGHAPDATHDDDDSPLKASNTKRPATKTPPPAAKKPADDSDDAASDDDSGAGKKVAAKGDDEDGGSVEKGTGDGDTGGLVDAAAQLSPGQRAVDANLGLSFTARKLNFTHTAALTNTPPGYNGVPVAGAFIDATVFPLAIGHKRKGIATGLGLALTYDRVLHVTSQVRYTDANMASQIATLPTKSSRFSIGAVFRYAFNDSATSPVIGAELRYGKQLFSVDAALPGGAGVADIPSVDYSAIMPSVNFHYPVSPKLEIITMAGLQLISAAGQISQADQYGPASVLGIDFSLGADYAIKKNIFVRAAFNVETIGFSFKGTGTLSNNRDMDPTQQDVFGARDTYLGGAVTVGYLY